MNNRSPVMTVSNVQFMKGIIKIYYIQRLFMAFCTYSQVPLASFAAIQSNFIKEAEQVHGYCISTINS